MRTLRAFTSHIVLFGILLTGNAHGSSDSPTLVTRNVSQSFEASVLTYSDEVIECYIVTPSMGVAYIKPHTDPPIERYRRLEDMQFSQCRVEVLDLNVNDTGIWTINSVSTKGIQKSQSYQLTVNPLEETNSTTTPPASKEEEEEDKSVTINDLQEVHFDAKIGGVYEVDIPYRHFIQTKGCYIVTPDNDRINLETQNISGIVLVRNENVACGVVVTVEQMHVGSWILISREIQYGADIVETRLPFVINVTVEIRAIPDKINVIEDKDFYVRLENLAFERNTCKLLRPDGTQHMPIEMDLRYLEYCGFIVRNVTQYDNGVWRIVYGKRIKYSAPFEVTVLPTGAQNVDNIRFVWSRDQPVQEIFGSDDVIYCKVVDPKGFVAFEGFGRCNITLARVTSEHDGYWRMYLGLRGRVFTTESLFTVDVVDKEPKAVVATDFLVITGNIQRYVTLTCKVSSPYPIQACKFRAPSGRILMANPGIGENNYNYNGKGSSYKSGVYTHDCGIQIIEPPNRDLGFWRCAIQTSSETYYGFLFAKWHWGWRDPEVVASVVTEPTLVADRSSLEALAGDSMLMSCSIQSAIDYCFFRSPNGTIYTVQPGDSSSDMGEYAGAGLDAGECNIRLRSVSVADTGSWSCHVGFTTSYKETVQQTAHINVTVKDIMTVTQNELKLTAVVEGRTIEECRFIRIDGLGFSSSTINGDKVIYVMLNQCVLYLTGPHPSPLERLPWTVVARIHGSNKEISRRSTGISSPNPDLTVSYRLSVFWLLLMVSGIMLIMTSVLLVPEKNRRWTYARATSIRASFRFPKKPVVTTEQATPERTTATAA